MIVRSIAVGFLLSVVAIVLGTVTVSLAAERAALERMVVNEVYDAHNGHYLSPTCETIREFGHAKSMDPGQLNQWEQDFHRAAKVGIISRLSFYLGLLELTRQGASFDALADKCLRGMPTDIEGYQSIVAATLKG